VYCSIYHINIITLILTFHVKKVKISIFYFTKGSLSGFPFGNGLISPLKGFTVHNLHLKFGNFIEWTPRQPKDLFKKSTAE
jgi:hypothetical protein